MTKKRKNSAATALPWCWYCDREFADEEVLIMHQKLKHFKCTQCYRKLASAYGLTVHAKNIHNEIITKIPNALPGRDSPAYDIDGMKGIPENDLQQHYIEVELRAAKRRAQGAGHSSKVSDEATGHSPGPINSIILPNTDNVSNSNREYSLFSESPINNLSSMKDSTAGFPTNSLQSSTSATLAIPSAQSAREASREALAHISRPSVVVAAAPALVMLTQPASHTYANINGLGSLTESRGHHQQSQITHQLYQNNSATDTTSTTENTFTPRGLPIPGIPNSYILTLDLNRSVEECRVDALYSRIHSVLP